MIEALWPYLVVIVAGFLPNEIFRTAAVFIGRGVDTESELFTWIRLVALTLLAAVVSKLLFEASGALASVPLILRIASVAIGVAAYFIGRRSLLLGILAGEGSLVGSAWLAG